MKKIVMAALLAFLPLVAGHALAEPMCEVKVCNKLSRFTLNPWKRIKDAMGETCYDTRMPESEAVEGRSFHRTAAGARDRSTRPSAQSPT